MAGASENYRDGPGGSRGANCLMKTRISGGSERGRPIRSKWGSGLRPTSERVRAAMFSILGTGSMKGLRVLDLYAGTGILGIEALSRGASWADFVESHAGRCHDIRDNLRVIGLDGLGQVHGGKVEKMLGLLTYGYDIVFIDPPYDMDPWDGILGRFGEGKLLNENARIVAEHYYKRDLPERTGRLVRSTVRRYGDTSISIYTLGEQRA